jgi:hypothetical protein
MQFISEENVTQEMQVFGLDRVQAVHRIRQRQHLLTARIQFPLGRNQSIDHDQEYRRWAAENPALAARHI